MTPPGTKHQVLMIADTEQDKNRWVGALNELHKLLRKNKIPDKSVSDSNSCKTGRLCLLYCTAPYVSEQMMSSVERI